MTDGQRLSDLFSAAMELDPEERAAFLDRECGSDARLQSELKGLLSAHAQSEDDGFLGSQSFQAAAGDAASTLADGLRVGQHFGRYRIVRLIGEGGMSEVYLAEDTELKRQVALKVIGGLRNAGLIRRFEAEGRILSRLSHENIAQLFDAGTSSDGVPFLVMEYVEGQSIVEYCETHALSLWKRLELFGTVCAAVQYAHRSLVVHRDLKPGNIFVEAGGRPKLLDFGIAKLLDPAFEECDRTTTLLRALTPVYASPEQCRGEPITTATDVYSLGVVLYEMLTGQTPYRKTGASALEMMRIVTEEMPARPGAVRPELRGDLEAILLKALRKEPESRYTTVEQFADDIRRHLEKLPVLARRGTWAYHASKFLRRNRLAVAASAAVLLSLTAGLAAADWQARIAQKRFNQVRRLAHAVLFDYHDKIASLPGSTAVRAQMVTDALAYLDGMARETGSDRALQLELASAYLRVGDVQGRPYSPNLGQSQGALASYRKGLGILEPILDRNPERRDVRRQVATACERIGSLELRTWQFERSARDQRRALSIREDLVAADPSDAALQQDLASSYIYLGDSLQALAWKDQNNIAALWNALHLQEKALALCREIAARDPKNSQFQRDLARANMRVGFRRRDIETFGGSGLFLDEALDYQQTALAIREQVAAANPGNIRDRRDATDQRMLLGDMQGERGNLAEAIAGYRAATAAFQSLHDADPSNVEARRDLSFGYLRLARAMRQLGDTRQAWQYFDTTLSLALQLVADDPNSTEDRTTVSGVYQAESGMAASAGNLALAIDLLQRAQASDAAFPARGGGVSLTAQWSWSLSLGYLNVTAANSKATPAAKRMEYWRAARDWFQKATDLLNAELAQNPTPTLRDFLGRARTSLDRCQEALDRGTTPP